MTNQFIFPVNIEADDDGRFVVTFPDLPFGVTDGATQDDTLSEAEDALDEVIAGLINAGEDGLKQRCQLYKLFNFHSLATENSAAYGI